MNDKYNENKNRNNFFLNSDELSKLANTLKQSFGHSVREVIDIINEKQTTTGNIIPIKDRRLVEQKPKELNSAKEAQGFNFIAFMSVAIGLIIIGNGITDLKYQGLDELPTFIIGTVFIAGGYFLRKMAKNKKQIANVMNRYNKYLRAFGNGTICNIKELAVFVNVDKSTVLEDLSYYIQKDYLKEARIVDEAVILDNATYNEYKKIPQPASGPTQKLDNNYLNELLNFLNLIEEPVKSDVKELLLIVEKIYKNAKENPQDLEQFEKFKEYYLPSVIKLLGEYEKIQKSDINSQKIIELKKDIESSIKIINEAFRNLLEDLYEGSVIDIKTDISVLKSMLYQEGLLDRI